MVEFTPEQLFKVSFSIILFAACCMNASDYWSDIGYRLLRNVSDTDMFLVQSAVTCGAFLWLIHRAWQTLWKPVPELISILGVEVPEPPQVSLAGIKSDSITLQWTPPETKTVIHKYLIQVNGVNVGDTTRSETSITVTGLKPAHFYNVRVIAVGNSNFQAGSRVIRLRTYNRDGRPEMGGRVPSAVLSDEASGTTAASPDSNEESPGHGVGLEAASMPEGSSAIVRDQASHAGSRRNTIARKHSASVAGEQPPIPSQTVDVPEGSMLDLTERFEAIRRETEDVIAQTAKDSEDNKVQMQELIKERDEKRQQLKEKEEASEKLKKEVHATERLNRQAQTKKSQKEKILKDKEAERDKMKSDMKKWENDIQEMQTERELWEKEKAKVATDTAKKVDELKSSLKKSQNKLTSMEEEIRVKGLHIKEMEEERKKLPGAEDDEETKALQAVDKLRDQQWENKEKELMARFNAQNIISRNLENDLVKAQVYFQQLSARHTTNPLMFHANSSGVNFENETGQQRPKQRRNRQRKSRTNTLSNSVNYPPAEITYNAPNPYGQLATNPSPNFAPGPYFDMSANAGSQSPDHTGMTDAEIKAFTAGAPLSPTATSLLPSNIFQDDDPPERSFGSTHIGSFPSLRPTVPSMFEPDPKYSPESSSRSASLLSSPQASQNNLPLIHSSKDNWHERDDRFPPPTRHSTSSFRAIGSPNSTSTQDGSTEPANKNRFGDLFSFAGKQRSKTLAGDGYPLGGLKAGQSASFPRQDLDSPELKNRRTSFTTGWDKLPFLNRGTPPGLTATEGNGPAPARNLPSRRRRGFNVFGNSMDDPNAGIDRSPSSPRPASIASQDLPRPSTDSAPFGWAPSGSDVLNRNSPLATNWSLNPNPLQPWSASRVPSRRPSINQQGMPTSGLATGGVLSDDDEYLAEMNMTSPSPAQVGVIGSRPISQMSNKLNPAAPTFKAMFARKRDKDKEGDGSEKKSRKGKEKEPVDGADDDDHIRPISERSNARTSLSRDTQSMHSLHSLTESYDSLELATSSNAMSFSEVQPSFTQVSSSLKSDGSKGETSFQKLLRKGSSSKFSIGSFGREHGWGVGGKKAKGKPPTSVDGSSGTPSATPVVDDNTAWDDEVAPTSSPAIGTPVLDKDGKEKEKEKPTSAGREGRMSVNWGRFSMKKNKERKSGELDRSVFDAGFQMSPSLGGGGDKALGSGVLLKGSSKEMAGTDDEREW